MSEETTWNTRIRELRTEAGLSQEGLAREISVSKNTIVNWENASNDIPGQKLLALADFFGCPPAEIYGFVSEAS